VNSELQGLMSAATFDTYGPPGVVRWTEVAQPVPGAGEVLIRTRFAAVNPIDCATRAGRGVCVERFPGVLGWDVAGTIVALGTGVPDYREGDEVFGLPRFPQHVGCCADYVVSPASALAPIPNGVSAREAGAVPMAALTAWQALHQWPGSLDGLRVFVHGASGGVGHVAVQLARQAGAHVIATASARNREFLTSLGADEIHDYTQSPFETVVRDVDVALDTRGGPDVERLVHTVKPGGMVVSLKGGGDRPTQAVAMAKGVQVRAIMVRPDRDALIQIAERLQDRSIHIEIESEFPIAEIVRAHAAVEAGHVRGRVILRAASGARA
jgi:NADPH:quinone reductase-like Zn-dependent oxidoreductase